MSNPDRRPPPADYDDNPEWTQRDFARAHRGLPVRRVFYSVLDG